MVLERLGSTEVKCSPHVRGPKVEISNQEVVHVVETKAANLVAIVIGISMLTEELSVEFSAPGVFSLDEFSAEYWETIVLWTDYFFGQWSE